MTLPIGEIVCGDCREVMASFPDGSFDAVVTDCPYGTGGWFRAETGLGAGVGKDVRMQEEWDEWSTDWLHEAFRVARTIISFLPQGRIAEVWGLRDRARLLVWAKPDPRPTFSVMHAFDPIMAWGPLQPVWSNDYMLHTAMKPNRNTEAVGHPHQKPGAVVRWLLDLACPPGGLVLDPFVGSGTTAVACVQTGRRFVGIDISPEYCEIARKRVAEALLQPRLDFDPAPKPTQGVLL